MKLPDNFPFVILTPSEASDGRPQTRITEDFIEALVRYCAEVCEGVSLEHNDPLQSLRCHNAILRKFGIEP